MRWPKPRSCRSLSFLGGSLAPVPAYNSNGLWLTRVDELSEQAAALVAEDGFQGL